jgi:arginyl-tRNA synthetase
MQPLEQIQERFRPVLTQFVSDPAPYLAMIRPAQDPKHGDYQANMAMALAKVVIQKSRDLAQQIIDKLQADDLVEPPQVAGPGFINLRLKTSWLAEQTRALVGDLRLGGAAVPTPRTIVVDYSSPNVAKPMHVGHLRSTIIGDALARLFRFLGHKVIADNHLGDWGTQFGMLLYGYKHFRDEEALARDPVREMARIYVHVRNLIKGEADEDAVDEATNPVAEAARQETAKLHEGDAENVELWRQFMPWCVAEIERIYQRLDVHFDHMHGESFYQPMLPGVVEELEREGIAEKSEGAVVIFLGPRDKEPPALIRKRDGAFTYTTSDLATIQYRVEHWHPDAMLYVVGAPQALHFKNVFAAARRWGYDRVALEHIAFGSVLGENRKAIKTREGGAIELESLLDEAVERAGQAYEETLAKRRAEGEDVPELAPDERRTLVEAVGIGAVKYADLSQNRTSDYVFNWDKMLAMDGNTATYMQYSYARVRSIFRKGDVDEKAFRLKPPAIHLDQPAERRLALQLVRLGEALDAAATEYKPHVITAYLWDLAKAYSGFYQTCPVLRADSPELRQSRLALCDLTARTIGLGLNLLGITVVERM